MPLFITACFYIYTSFTGPSILPVNITIFALAVASGQFASYRVLAGNAKTGWLNRLGLVLMVALGAAYVAFTYLPPHLGLFREETSGRYGISES
jgi:hypothetical protein